MSACPALALESLARFSASLGADVRIIQGAGGNTSIKLAGADGRMMLHVKASGLWLRDALRRPSFIAVDLAGLLARLCRAAAEPGLADLVSAGQPGMRPSIETGLHAVMPHRVVVHTHSVSAIAHLVAADPYPELARRLDGMRWALVPYARPGLPLLRAVEAVGGAGCDVLMLQNHGLVFGADDVEAAARLHADLERRLELPARATIADLAPIERLLAGSAAGLGWRLASHGESHALGIDPASLTLAGRGAFYPDHVVFLGPGPVAALPGPADAAWLARAAGAKLLLLPGLGAVTRTGIGDGAEEMVRCLALVLARVDPAIPVRTLHAQDEAELQGWEAEIHRRALGAALEGRT